MKLLFNTTVLGHLNIPITMRKFILLIFLMPVNTFTAQANLLITPTRIEFDQRERSAKVSLVNTSTETKTYKIFWRQQKQLPDGRYQHFTSEEEMRDFPRADSMLRYSPRQVTLKPGERQHIRIAVRRPKGIQDGEYRSHLVFEAKANKRDQAAGYNVQPGIKLYVNLAFSIPIIVREGNLHSTATLKNVELITKQVNGSTLLGANITINRNGLHSSFGNLSVYWQDTASSTEKQIGILNNIAIYTEVDERKVTIGLPEHSVKSGTLRIVYKGSKEYDGLTFIDQSLIIKGSDYHPMATDLVTQ
ncbi:MAG: fimbrial chaperone protein [Alteromonadaceae bacterium]|jgi:fimbrial chaperone protein